MPTFDDFFRRATATPDLPKGHTPHGYQARIATAGLPAVLQAPTGTGKTGVILAWLWRRLHGPDPACTPLRLGADGWARWIAAGVLPPFHGGLHCGSASFASCKGRTLVLPSFHGGLHCRHSPGSRCTTVTSAISIRAGRTSPATRHGART